MTARKHILDRVEISSPCTANWDEMKGTEQIRYCSECDKYVYNLSEMTRREAEELVVSSGDQMCARLTRDLKGQTLTVESLPPVRLLGWKPGRVANAVVSALISITPAAVPLASGQAASQSAKTQDGSGHKSHRTVPAGATSTITGIVKNETGQHMPGALVTLTSEASGEVFSQLTSQEGEYRFDGLAARTYIIEIQAMDYEAVRNHDVTLQPGEARRFDVGMERLIIVSGAIARPAQPLRTLYRESDRVVVAEVGKSTDAEQKGQIKTRLNIFQTIKGDGHKSAIALYHWSYNRDRLIEGQTVLVFMQRRGDVGASDRYDLLYGDTSAKHLSPADLQTYLQRIQELKEIAGKSDAAPSDIVEWLVRCAEDPVTRREGTFELNASARWEQYERVLAEREAAAPGDLLSSLRRRARQELLFALLTSEQKERLVNALLKSENLAVNGDFELIELVRRFYDPRLLPFLLSYLHRFETTAPETLWQSLQTVAELLDDKTLVALSRHYIESEPFESLEADQKKVAIAESDDDAEIESDEQEEEEVESDEDEDTEEDETADTIDDVDTAPKLTQEAAQQIRVELLKKFLAAAEAKMKLAATK